MYVWYSMLPTGVFFSYIYIRFSKNLKAEAKTEYKKLSIKSHFLLLSCMVNLSIIFIYIFIQFCGVFLAFFLFFVVFFLKCF